MYHYIKKYAYLIPSIMLFATFISNFIKLDSTPILNSLGYSILSNITMYLYFNRSTFCWLTRNIPLALIFINILDIASCFILTVKQFNILFNISICAITISMTLIFELKKRLNESAPNNR